jgi:hypothetical protein
MVGNIADSDSVKPFSLYIENVSINDTCMTIHVGNRLNHEVSVESAYINDERREFFSLLKNADSIPSKSTGILYVNGPFVSGGLYDIKLVFNYGGSVISVARY